MRKIGQYLDILCSVVAGVCMVGMIGMNFADSIGRQLSRPVLGAQEFVSLALAIFFFASIPILVRENAQIRVGLFVELYSGILKRIEPFVSGLLETAGTLLLAWLVYDRAKRVEAIGTLSNHFELPIYPFLYVGSLLLACTMVFLIERFVTHRTRPNRPEVPKEAHSIRHDEEE